MGWLESSDGELQPERLQMTEDQTLRILATSVGTPVLLLVLKQAQKALSPYWCKVWTGLPYRVGYWISKSWPRRHRRTQ